jgi:hypothetical protein
MQSREMMAGEGAGLILNLKSPPEYKVDSDIRRKGGKDQRSASRHSP